MVFSISSPKKCNGISMIEVLITLVVVSLGLLSLMGMQAQGLKNNHSAYLKSQVISTVNNMAERMRSNAEGLKNNRYAAIDTSTVSSTPGKNCISSSCSEEELATYDIYAWGKGLSNILPQGYGTVEIELRSSCDDNSAPSCSDSSVPSCDLSSNLVCSDASTSTCTDTSTPFCIVGPNHTINVFWDDDRDGSANTSFSVTTAL